MVRPPSKILTFKRLTRGSRGAAWHLDSNIRKKVNWIFRKIDANRSGQSERAYLCVAMASCLEADIKHRAKLALDIHQNDVELFKKLYGEAKLDLDLLFHVVDDRIELGDLVAEVTSVSDARGLVNRCENLLNAVSGSKKSLLEHVKGAAVALRAGDSMKMLFDIILATYDGLVPELDRIFQIRHAVIHDVFNQGGPVGWAVRPDRLRHTFMAFLNFLMVWQDTYWHAVHEGIIPKRHPAPDGEKIRKEVLARERRIVRRQPKTGRYIQKLDDCLVRTIWAICEAVGAIEGKRKPNRKDQEVPHDIHATWLRFTSKLSTQLDLYSLDEAARKKERSAARRAKSDPAVRKIRGQLRRAHRQRSRGSASRVVHQPA